ncbi:ganglioside-induced differentiation-associated protein 1 [Aplysia californica]|uniref:Ganglioside-induced differentiation-associated protein 1 n=1 Tax=Aplysia californica TaxID=6500 RepID=A0ABM0K8D4_APLCA|nr:ganglioside-induced differentiation-associated protein 1 [Aplysia californica]
MSSSLSKTEGDNTEPNADPGMKEEQVEAATPPPRASESNRNGKEKPEDIVIYYFPTSYSSQKVLISLFEKKLKFKPSIVSLFHGQHMEPWYVRLNPNGAHVPVLVHGEMIINDPDRIIDYVDKLQGTSGPQLVPSRSSDVGQKVSRFRSMLSKIPVDVISYGIIFHPQLSGGRCQLPLAIQRSMRENFANRLRYLITLSTVYPDLRDCYLAKSQTAAEKYDLITDEDRVRGQIDQLDGFLNSVEEELREKYGLEEGSKQNQMFLYGESLTVADIGLYVLITRLQILGLLPQSVPSSRYPLIHRHFTLLSARPSIGKLLDEMSKLRYTLLLEDIKASGSYVAIALGAGLVVLAAYYLVKKLKR